METNQKVQVQEQVQKALKHDTKERLAVVTTHTVFFSTLQGLINRHFPSKNFNAEHYRETVDFPGDFEAAKKAYFDLSEDERRSLCYPEREERRIKEEQRKAAATEQERIDELNLEQWKLGKKECYVVSHYEDIHDPYYSSEPEDYEYSLFFDLSEAEEAYNDILKENEDYARPGYMFIVELTHLQTSDKGKCINIPIEERQNITSIEDIYEEYLQHSDVGGLDRDAIDSEIPEKSIIITYKNDKMIYATWAVPHERTCDLKADTDNSYKSYDVVYSLKECLDWFNNEKLCNFVIAKVPLTREDCAEYMDERTLDIVFGEEEEEENE
ncbi:MAG: hypothetical protein LBS23_02055 [Holosporaceae bacterium]|jgi:hypothetical protein|nr:hypothetical protein [Holosporaceae bacterium]